MIRALYTATSGMLVESRRMDLASRNLFGAQSPGYKAVRDLRASLGPTNPTLPSDVQTEYRGEFVDPSPGALRQTGRPLDLALEGEGFFAVQTSSGVAYTRDGRFRRAADGIVRNANGHALLGQRGAIELPRDTAIHVMDDGVVRIADKVADRLVLRDFPGYRGLQGAGASLYFPTGAAADVPSEARVLQGHVEDANVQAVAEMTRTIEAIRAFESYQKVVQTVMEDVTGEAVRRLGRVA